MSFLHRTPIARTLNPGACHARDDQDGKETQVEINPLIVTAEGHLAALDAFVDTVLASPSFRAEAVNRVARNAR